MAKRKISIDEAFKVFEEAGIPLQAKPVDVSQQLPTQIPVEDAAHTAKATQHNNVAKLTNNKLVKVTLFAKHSVGSGGTATVNADGDKVVEHAGVQTYGPGICIVNADLASHLLSADQSAKAADARMLEREQRSYLIVQRVSNDGSRANVGMAVPDGFLDERLGSLPIELMHMIR
jgi:NifU-like protein involved in Fe-S cluster formation